MAIPVQADFPDLKVFCVLSSQEIIRVGGRRHGKLCWVDGCSVISALDDLTLDMLSVSWKTV